MSAKWIKSLTKAQRQRLNRYACAWCDIDLHHGTCGAIYDKPCTEATMKTRAAKCLEASRVKHIRSHPLTHT